MLLESRSRTPPPFTALTDIIGSQQKPRTSIACLRRKLSPPFDRRKDTTYYNPQVKMKRGESGNISYRIRGTIGGDRINGADRAMPFVKLLLQAAMSENVKVLTMDAQDSYLNTPLTCPEFLRIPLKFIPPCVLDKHHLRQFISGSSVLFSVHRGKYGLPKSSFLAQLQLVTHLRLHSYHQTATPCLLRHISNGAFTLVIDDFLVKYPDKPSADHLHRTLSMLYETKIDWSTSKYIGFTLSVHGQLEKRRSQFSYCHPQAANVTSGHNSASSAHNFLAKIYQPHSISPDAPQERNWKLL